MKTAHEAYTTTAYCPCCDNPATITDALGNTTCYRYDERGRKVAEWGTAIQPALFGYDDADRMTTLTTFRAGMETISTDPAGRTDGDTTTWTYDDPTGLETAKTYADGNGTVKSYVINLSRREALIEVEGLVPENEISDAPRRPSGDRRRGGNNHGRRDRKNND